MQLKGFCHTNYSNLIGILIDFLMFNTQYVCLNVQSRLRSFWKLFCIIQRLYDYHSSRNVKL